MVEQHLMVEELSLVKIQLKLIDQLLMQQDILLKILLHLTLLKDV